MRTYRGQPTIYPGEEGRASVPAEFMERAREHFRHSREPIEYEVNEDTEWVVIPAPGFAAWLRRMRWRLWDSWRQE